MSHRSVRQEKELGDSSMKAFISAVVAAVVIAIGAAFALDHLGRSTAETNQSQTGNVRL
jgi:formate/nitrite transporter FocA (FNT family)